VESLARPSRYLKARIESASSDISSSHCTLLTPNCSIKEVNTPCEFEEACQQYSLEQGTLASLLHRIRLCSSHRSPHLPPSSVTEEEKAAEVESLHFRS
jgi:hypothetical protein